jgi:hypothetical protein
MPEPKHFLSFSTSQEGDQVFIHADAEGLDVLIASLTRVRLKLKDDVCEHDHFMSDAWGGSDLSTRTLGSDGPSRAVDHVKIYGWTKEWAIKHGPVASA